MEPLLWEMCNCIFVEFPEHETRFTGENFLSNLLSVRTFFELYQEAHDALEDVRNLFLFLFLFNHFTYFVYLD